MKQIALAALLAAALLFSAKAEAQSDWYMYDSLTNNCHESSVGNPADPQTIIDFLKGQGDTFKVKTVKYPDGSIRFVEVDETYPTGPDVTFLFFTSENDCGSFTTYVAHAQNSTGQVQPPLPSPTISPALRSQPPAQTPSPTLNSQLPGADRNAIGAHVRPCFNVDAGAPGLDTFSVKILVQTDASGVIRNAVISPDDQDKLSDPNYNAYAQRAISAALNYQCSDLSSVLPPNMIGQPQNFVLQFSP